MLSSTKVNEQVTMEAWHHWAFQGTTKLEKVRGRKQRKDWKWFLGSSHTPEKKMHLLTCIIADINNLWLKKKKRRAISFPNNLMVRWSKFSHCLPISPEWLGQSASVFWRCWRGAENTTGVWLWWKQTRGVDREADLLFSLPRLRRRINQEPSFTSPLPVPLH